MAASSTLSTCIMSLIGRLKEKPEEINTSDNLLLQVEFGPQSGLIKGAWCSVEVAAILAAHWSKVSLSFAQWPEKKLQKRVWAKPKGAFAHYLHQIRYSKARWDFL